MGRRMWRTGVATSEKKAGVFRTAPSACSNLKPFNAENAERAERNKPSRALRELRVKSVRVAR